MSEAGPSSGVKVEDEAEAVADEFMDLDTPAEGAEAVNLISLRLSTVNKEKSFRSR